MRLIEDPNEANVNKTHIFPLPGYSDKFPFLAVCGEDNLSILNVNTCVHKPLIKQKMTVGHPGIQGAFMTEEVNGTGVQVHFANTVQDKTGEG